MQLMVTRHQVFVLNGAVQLIEGLSLDRATYPAGFMVVRTIANGLALRLTRTADKTLPCEFTRDEAVQVVSLLRVLDRLLVEAPYRLKMVNAEQVQKSRDAFRDLAETFYYAHQAQVQGVAQA